MDHRKPNRSGAAAAVDSALHGASIGIVLALWVGSLQKMSSDKSVLPLACERCGHLEKTPAAQAAQANDSTARTAGRCPACGHGWFVPVRSDQITLRRKPDRRGTARDE